MSITREEIARAVNAGADLVIEGLGLGERDLDLIYLVVNAALTSLDKPDADLDEVIDENYADDPETVRSWWTNWD